ATLVARAGDAQRGRLALLEDACYTIYQPKVASEAIKRTDQQNAAMCFHPQRPDICLSTDIRQGIFDAGKVVYWAL
ncbi:sugar glycosyltransferase, partial [Klebsiella pneumoniae]|nr:sugar glycosyltransferase [Klebsiella pneumoniae]